MPVADAPLDPVALVHALTGVLRSLSAGTDGRAGGVALDDDARIRLVGALQEVSSAAAAATLRAYADHDAARRRQAAAAGVPAARHGQGVARELGLASKTSHHAAQRRLGVARLALAEMPHAFERLVDGTLHERQVTMLVSSTACVDLPVRQAVDRQLCAVPARLHGIGEKQLEGEVARLVQRLDPAGVAARATRAAQDRHVSSRPAPDTMCRVSALLPVEQGVAVIAALRQAATRARATGDPRSRGQVMADTLVQRVTGQATAEGVPIAVGLLLRPPTALPAPGGVDGPAEPVDGASHADGPLEPSWLLGHGPVDALTTRALLEASWSDDLARAASSLRRLWTDPATGALVAMDARSRAVPDGLAAFVHARDLGLCRTPWCDAPVRHTDHVTPVAGGGLTREPNLQGLCEACNYAKEAPGWTHRTVTAQDAPQRAGPHRVRITTPAGHSYTSRSPDLPGTPAPATASSRPRHRTVHLYVGGPELLYEPAA